MGEKARKIHIIGINSLKFEDLSINLQKLYLNTKNIAIPSTFFYEIKNWHKESTNKDKIFFKSSSDNKLISWIDENKNDIILFSRGDPLWFGIGRVLLENFKREELFFYPSNTSLQMAFSKLKRPWNDANFISIHGRDSSEMVKYLKSLKSNLTIIPDSKESIIQVKNNLIELNLENNYELWVCEDLGLKNERIRLINIKETLPDEISDLSIYVLLRKDNQELRINYPLFGINDNLFKTYPDRPNLITKREIRIQILADLELPEKGVLWDIGAGCGTIGLEALRLRPKLNLFSIDKRLGTTNLIKKNAKKLKVFPKSIIEKDINIILKEELNISFPRPNRVVIGGCNKETKLFIIKKISKIFRYEDIFVIPLATYESLNEIKKLFTELNFEAQISLIQTYKSITISEGNRFEPNNPVFIVKAKKK